MRQEPFVETRLIRPIPVDPARNLLRALLPEHQNDARREIEDRRGKGMLVLPGALGTPFAGWSKAKAALDKGVVDARAKAAAAAGTSPTPIVPWSIPPGSHRGGFEPYQRRPGRHRGRPTLVRMQEIGRHAYASTEMTLWLRGALRQ